MTDPLVRTYLTVPFQLKKVLPQWRLEFLPASGPPYASQWSDHRSTSCAYLRASLTTHQARSPAPSTTASLKHTVAILNSLPHKRIQLPAQRSSSYLATRTRSCSLSSAGTLPASQSELPTQTPDQETISLELTAVIHQAATWVWGWDEDFFLLPQGWNTWSVVKAKILLRKTVSEFSCYLSHDNCFKQGGYKIVGCCKNNVFYQIGSLWTLNKI